MAGFFHFFHGNLMVLLKDRAMSFAFFSEKFENFKKKLIMWVWIDEKMLQFIHTTHSRGGGREWHLKISNSVTFSPETGFLKTFFLSPCHEQFLVAPISNFYNMSHLLTVGILPRMEKNVEKSIFRCVKFGIFRCVKFGIFHCVKFGMVQCVNLEFFTV